MYQAIIIIHILLGLGIIGLILMQQGKGADAGATFGGGASGSVFGAQGAASFLSRTTAILATMFFVTSLGLAWINGNKGVAADLMSVPGVEKESPETGLPNVDGANAIETAPVPQVDNKESTAKQPEVVEKPAAVVPAPVAPSAATDTANKPVSEAAAPVKPDEAVVEEKESELKTETPPPAKPAASRHHKKKK